MTKQKTLAELFAEPETVHDTPLPQAAPDPKPATREDEFAERLDALLIEANEQRAMSELVGALTYTLARIARHYGKPYIAGDIVRRFGAYLCVMEESKTAHAEAAEARAAGRAFN